MRFLGTGSAFTIKNWQSNVLVEVEDGTVVRRLLIDAGGDIRHSLAEQKLNYMDVDAVFISHLHGDHAQGLEYLGFCNFSIKDGFIGFVQKGQTIEPVDVKAQNR